MIIARADCSKGAEVRASAMPIFFSKKYFFFPFKKKFFIIVYYCNIVLNNQYRLLSRYYCDIGRFNPTLPGLILKNKFTRIIKQAETNLSYIKARCLKAFGFCSDFLRRGFVS